jgi:hypothetical protein
MKACRVIMLQSDATPRPSPPGVGKAAAAAKQGEDRMDGSEVHRVGQGRRGWDGPERASGTVSGEPQPWRRRWVGVPMGANHRRDGGL